MADEAVMTKDREIRGMGLVRAGTTIHDPKLARQLVAQGIAVRAPKPSRKKTSAGKTEQGAE